MSKLYDLKLMGNEVIEITEEQKVNIVEAVVNDRSHISVGESFIKVSAIMAIMPSKKNNPYYSQYLKFKNDTGKNIPFDNYLDQIGYQPNALTEGK